MNDAQNVLEQLVIVRDALCFRRTARPTICRATGEEAKRTVFRWKWSLLDRMKGRIALEERVALLRLTQDERWAVELYLLALSQYDSVAIQELDRVLVMEGNNLRLSPLVDLLRFVGSHWTTSNVSEFMQVECFPSWERECSMFPLLSELYHNLLLALTE